MVRKSGIWLRKQNKTWHVSHRGKQVNLGKDIAAAEKKYHKLMAEDSVELVSADENHRSSALDKFLLCCSDNPCITSMLSKLRLIRVQDWKYKPLC